MSSNLATVLGKIDAANARDPKIETADDGTLKPAALLYGERMSLVLYEFEKAPSDVLQIAVRGQHIERWTRPRADYPDGRAGYLQWRRDAALFHGERLAALMAADGYCAQDCEHVQRLVRKLAIKTDAEAQSLEDVASLVFMRWYFAPFAASRTPDELFTIVQKTAKKMSARGRQEALKLPLPASLVPAVMAGQ